MDSAGDNFDTFNAIETRRGIGEAADVFLTAQELLEHLHNQGYEDVTDDQLTRWHKEDCLPRPHQVHEIGRRGSASYYPAHAVPQALALCRMCAKKRYSFDELRVMLWVDGFPIPAVRVRASLHCLIQRIWDELHRRSGTTKWRDLLGIAQRLAEQAAPMLARSVLGRLTKRRLGASDWAGYLTLQFQLLLGDKRLAFGTPERSLGQVIVDAFGLQRAQTDHLGLTTPWLPLNIAPTLIDLARRRIFSLRYAVATIDRATDSQLAQALIDRQVMFTELPEVARGADLLFGEGAFGFGMFRILASVAPQDDATYQALQIVGLLVVRRSGYSVALDQVSAAIHQAAQCFTRYEALVDALTRELPDYMAELSPALATSASSSTSGRDLQPVLQARENRIREIAERHLNELHAFCERHPEFSDISADKAS